MVELIISRLTLCIAVHISQSVNGITGRHLFRTCRNAIMAIQCLELLSVALLLMEMNNTATTGSSTSEIPYPDQ